MKDSSERVKLNRGTGEREGAYAWPLRPWNDLEMISWQLVSWHSVPDAEQTAQIYTRLVGGGR